MIMIERRSAVWHAHLPDFAFERQLPNLRVQLLSLSHYLGIPARTGIKCKRRLGSCFFQAQCQVNSIATVAHRPQAQSSHSAPPNLGLPIRRDLRRSTPSYAPPRALAENLSVHSYHLHQRQGTRSEGAPAPVHTLAFTRRRCLLRPPSPRASPLSRPVSDSRTLAQQVAS